jgi:hypothetical protein
VLRALLFALALLLALPASAAPSGSPTPLYRRPAGWHVPKTITVSMRKFAESLLTLKLGAWRGRTIDGKRYAARVEWHYDGTKGWHRGVSVYEVRRRAKP